MIADLGTILKEIFGNSDRRRNWQVDKALCLMGTINHLLYVSAAEAGAVFNVSDETTGTDFLRLDARKRPKMLKAGFRASLSGIAAYLAEHWPLATNSRRAVRYTNDCLERWGLLKRHVFFERNKNAGIDSEVHRFSYYTRLDVVGLLQLFEALESHLVSLLERGAIRLGDRVLKKTQDLYEHGAMFMQSLFAFFGVSDKPFGSGETPTVAPGSPEARLAQEDIALSKIDQADDILVAVAECTPADEPLIDASGELLDEDCSYSRAGIIYSCLTRGIQHAWNVISPSRQPTALDEPPAKTGAAGAWAWEALIEENPDGLW